MTEKKYYTIDELDKDIDKFIEETAEELIIELREKRKIISKKEIYV
jgi:hypothetical protein